MRVLITGCGSRGDIEPLVALAVRLRELGAQVRTCLPPDYAQRCAEVGVPMVAVGRPVRAGARGPGEPPPGAVEVVAEVVAEWFDAVPAAAEGCDVVVSTGLLPTAVVARSVAEKLGVPYFYTIFSPDHLPSARSQEQRDLYNEGADRHFGDPVNAGRAAIGLPPVRDLFDYGYTDHPLLATDPVLAPPAAGLDAVQTGAWVLPDQRSLPAELEAFLAAGPPPVYVGFGSSSGSADAARASVDAARAHGRRVVLSRGWDELALDDDRDDCLAIGEVNLQALFGRVAAAVHHDSAGTTFVATLAGVPQVVLRHVIDNDVAQVYYSDRVAELGVGVALDGPIPDPEALSAAFATALTPDTRDRAAAVAATIRTDGTSVTAALLFAAAGVDQPPVPA
ncbi:GT1-family glycosyltransferase [Actinokineospora auranticolor]|uniref:Chloroorienticin B synthase/vancomycin aglycone glucosyltransferase n=1 Tax=Actinokineospora auranticolor TaxID=155976 RepID=A0A2S6GUC8_9PSEU|nr:glycosyltransferase [Actinokineospora auranticolor]PPK68814.1 chloroorienticin B synthase/vancomycin aglycone glucosyltransferase [Actinokineospora auranticolor]